MLLVLDLIISTLLEDHSKIFFFVEYYNPIKFVKNFDLILEPFNSQVLTMVMKSNKHLYYLV